MSSRRARVATDGLVWLSHRRIEKYRIIVVPRRIKVGERSLISDHDKTISDVNRRLGKMLSKAQVSQPEVRHFQLLYLKAIAEERKIVSVHLMSPFDGACHQAKIACNLLESGSDVEVYESAALGYGTGFMVETAARFASQNRANDDQVMALLDRLERDVHVFIVTGKPKELPLVDDSALSDSVINLVSNPKVLLEVNQQNGKLEVLGQDGDMVRLLKMSRQHIGKIEGPAEVSIRCFRKTPWVGQIAAFLSRGLDGSFEFTGIRQAGLEASYLPSDGAEIVFLPTAGRIKNMIEFAKKWG